MAGFELAASDALNSKFRRVNKISISEDIAQQILDLISNGDLSPGQRLPSERELCKTFGAARSSLREALRCLSIIGVLNARVGEGTLVATDGGKFLGKITEWRLITERHDIENLLEVRIALEGTAAANVALHGSDEAIARLGALLSEMKVSLKDKKRFAELDLDFHVTLARASGNSLLFDLVSMIRNQLVRGLSKVLLLPNAVPLSFQEHTAIVRAIEQRDAEGARKAMHAHLDAALRRHKEAAGKRIAKVGATARSANALAAKASSSRVPPIRRAK